MLRPFILIALLMLVNPLGLYAQKILCISDYQGRGKAATLERLLDTVIAREERIDTLIVAGDYIDADDFLAHLWAKLDNPPEELFPEVLLARGNHDRAASLVLDSVPPHAPGKRSTTILLPRKKPGQILVYQSNEVLFLVTDPFLSFRRKGYTRRQLDRLDELLSTSTCTHAFVVGHMPAFPKFRHVGKSIDHFTYARDRLVRILARYNAHFIHGHDHYANLIQVNESLHIDCGTINGAYGSAAFINTEVGSLDVRIYEVFRAQEPVHHPKTFQFIKSGISAGGRPLQKRYDGGDKRFRPIHLWGSRQIPRTSPRFIEMGLMEANLEYLLDWINYFL